jgi:hypothetical protein
MEMNLQNYQKKRKYSASKKIDSIEKKRNKREDEREEKKKKTKMHTIRI